MVSLEDCLSNFIKEEDMDSGYKCQRCKKATPMTKGLSIYRLPQILCLHMKRFYNSSIRREKINTTVNISEFLDMKKYAPYSSKFFHLLL